MSRVIPASRKPVWIALGVALLIHAGLISVQAGRRFDTRFVRMYLLDSLAPLEKLFDRSLYGIVYVWDSYFALIGVHKENEQLKQQVDDLKLQLEKRREDAAEVERLRTLLSISDSGIGRTVVSRVIGRDPTRSNQTVTIDKGLSHGVKPDAAVITSNGIIGRVIHSSNFFSIVQLVIDSQSAVGVMLESTRRQGVLKGNGSRELELEYIDDDNDLKEGLNFITSGQDRIYPKGMQVGVITAVGPRRGLLRTVQVRPAADLDRLEEVICILDRPQNVDVTDPALGPPTP
jgi:rod shape-determining protein MreC